MRDVAYVVAVIETALSRFRGAGGATQLAEVLAGGAASTEVVAPDIADLRYGILWPFPPVAFLRRLFAVLTQSR